jgi:hypothetical protein
VPNNAAINYVTTRKAGGTKSGASVSGGTMVWVYGVRFPPNLSPTQPSAQSSAASITLTNSLNSYSCEIHTDKCTSTQLTCYTSAMQAGTYNVRVVISGVLIPLYQYVDVSRSVVIVNKTFQLCFNEFNNTCL